MGRLPLKVIAATTLVAVAPAAVVWGLKGAGVLNSFVACAALGAALSLGACHLAARLWERRTGTEDVLFGDLMIWGWIRRGVQQRRLADAVSVLGLRRTEGSGDPLTISVERRAGMLERLAADLEARDPYTHGHSRRVARYAAMIAKRMGLSAAEVARIRTAATIHDIGKLDTPIEILHKPSGLTAAEFEIVKLHPATGAQMVSIMEDEQLTAIVRHHHERLDGTGYPDRLAGAEIPLGARIIAIADTFDAITSARSYRAARPHRQALEILRSEAGAQLDRDGVTAFCSVYSGRRPLGAWVAVTDVVERLIAWFAPDALSSTARVMALAATTAAVGGGVAALPASARHTSARQPAAGAVRANRATAAQPGRTSAGRAIDATYAATRSPERRRSSGSRLRSRGAGATARGVGPSTIAPPPRSGTSSTVGATTGTAGAGAGPATPVGGPSGTTAGVGSGTGAADPGTGDTGSGLHVSIGSGPSGGANGGVHVSAGVGSGTATVGVSAGGSSGVSAGVSLGSGGTQNAGQSSGTPSVSVTAGGSGGSSQSGVGVQVNAPGVGSINVHLG